MSGRLLLDTNAVITLFRDDPAAKSKSKNADEVFLPGIVLGELLYGALRSGRKEENAARCRRFAAANTVGSEDGIIVARDARGVWQVGERLPTPRAVGEAGLVGAYPPSVRRGRSAGTGDQEA